MESPDHHDDPLKIYFIPYLASGHIIPLCDIARLFASRGQHVTVITTPSNAQVLPHRISMKAAPPKQSREFIEQSLETALKSNGFIVNNFVELEGEEYLEHYERSTASWACLSCSENCSREGGEGGSDEVYIYSTRIS